MDLKSLSGPERVLVERLVLDEPLVVVNAWLVFNGYRELSVEGLKSAQDKFRDLIVKTRSGNSQDNVLGELDEIRTKLFNMSSGEEVSAKDMAQLSNALNAVSKTISDYVEKKKSLDDTGQLDVHEFLQVLKFLRTENIISFGDDKLDELRQRLLETIPQE